MTEQRVKLRKAAPSRGSKPGELRGQAGKGRKPGAVNKIPAALKETILKALEVAGGVDYLARQAVEQPQAFLALLGKALPQDVRATIAAIPITPEQADRVIRGD